MYNFSGLPFNFTGSAPMKTKEDNQVKEIRKPGLKRGRKPKVVTETLPQNNTSNTENSDRTSQSDSVEVSQHSARSSDHVKDQVSAETKDNVEQGSNDTQPSDTSVHCAESDNVDADKGKDSSCSQCSQLQSEVPQPKRRGRKPKYACVESNSSPNTSATAATNYSSNSSVAGRIKKKLLQKGRRIVRKVGRPRTKHLTENNDNKNTTSTVQGQKKYGRFKKILHRKKSHSRLKHNGEAGKTQVESANSHSQDEKGMEVTLDSVDATIDSVIRSVCSEYEPLPTKQQDDATSEGDVVTKEPKKRGKKKSSIKKTDNG